MKTHTELSETDIDENDVPVEGDGDSDDDETTDTDVDGDESDDDAQGGSRGQTNGALNQPTDGEPLSDYGDSPPQT